ncbi:ATP-binding cassette domain-containing protein [Halomicroarcula limicola]|uniref:ATP-binding cassette domain-containing protein n=1 Tax=Haloarcula limicola TaxID=1429915 RepID=A0A8J7YA24_9EURY|nr:ATP-binding cassette domain-containing protein [Halomicroarcula limicola]MBV0924034.1 ATP-binding cassette domain-containing protein [Halomicroarcula limicola]
MSESASGDPNVRETAAQLATGTNTETLLQTDDVVKRFGGFTATDHVDFGVKAGEIRCLIGPNGAGKSTLMKLITGQHPVTEGSVYFNGSDITDDDPHERIDRGLSMKFQVPSVFEELTVRENARLPVQRFASGDDRRRRVDESLSAAGLDGEGETRAGDLSHGQQQQLEIAMAASLEPDLLLLDEPVAGLSTAERRAIAERIETLNEERGIAFIVIEHDTDFVERISEQVTVLHQGSVFREGTIDEIKADPEVQRIYLGGDAE